MSSLWSHGSSSVNRRKAPASSMRFGYMGEQVVTLKKVEQLTSSSKENQKKRPLPANNGVAPKRTVSQRCKGALSDATSRSNGEGSGFLDKKAKARMLSSDRGGAPRNPQGVPKLQGVKGKLGNERGRSPCGSDSSSPDKNRCSKMPFMSYLKSKIDAAGSVLGKTKKQRGKQVGEANCFRPAVGYEYDAVECDLISCEQDLSELNLLPEGFLPRKPTNHSVLTPKSCPTFNGRQFHAFDGSRYSPMEEASLVLDDAPATMVDKENKRGPSRNALEEMIQVHDGTADSILSLQLASTWFSDSLDQSTSEDRSSVSKSTASESTYGESCSDSSCISSSVESPSIHRKCDKIACSDLKDLDLGKSLHEKSSHLFENEANKVAEELVAKAVKSVQHSRSCSFDDTLLCGYNDRRRSFFPLEQSLLQLDDINGECSHDPLFWPFNPKSYFSDEHNFDSSLYKMDSDCKPNTPSPEALTSNPFQSKLCNVSKKKFDRQSSAPKNIACDFKKKTTTDKSITFDLKEQTTADKSISSIKASNFERLGLLSDDNTLSKNIITPVSRKLSTDSTARRLGETSPSDRCKSTNSSMYSNNYLTSANNNSTVIADQALDNFPDMETECFVTVNDSIEFLLGMKEFDGQEGLKGTVNKEQGDQDLGFKHCVHKYGQLHSCGRPDLIYNSKLPIVNLEQVFQDLQINPKYEATEGLSNTGNQDCNDIVEDKFDKVERPACCVMENAVSQGTDPDKSKEREEIKTVMHMDYDNNPNGYPLPTIVIPFTQKNVKSFEYNSQDAKYLVPCEEFGMERKVEALEAELLEVKMQNKKLERLLKDVVKKTNTMEQSLHDRKQCLYGKRPVFRKFALHQRRKSGNKHHQELFCIKS